MSRKSLVLEIFFIVKYMSSVVIKNWGLFILSESEKEKGT